MRPRLLLLLLLFICLPAFATEWRPFSVPYRSGSAARVQERPAIASHGDEYLVAWPTSMVGSVAYYFTRVSSDGRVIGEVATQLGNVSSVGDIHLANSKDGYLAVWNRSATAVTAAALDTTGRIIRQTDVDEADVGTVKLAGNGSAFLLVYSHSGQAVVTLFDDSGNPVARSIPLGPSPGALGDFAVVGDTRGFLLVASRYTQATNQTELVARRIGNDGTIGAWQVLAAGGWVSYIVASNDGVRDRVAWSVPGSGTFLVDIDTRTDQPTSPVALSVPSNSQIAAMYSAPGTTWIAGTTYILGRRRIWAATVTGDGHLGSVTDVGEGGDPAFASTGSSTLLVYAGPADQPVPNEIRGRFVALSIAPEFIVSRSRVDQSGGSLAGNGLETLAVWSEIAGGLPQIYAGRLSSEGVPLDGAGMQLSAGGANSNPVAAFNGVDWLVAWNHRDDDPNSATTVVARRISSAGVLLDATDIEIAPSSLPPRVTSDGSNWLVGWIAWLRQQRACNNLGGATRAMATLVSPAGLVLNRLGRMLAPADVATDESQLDVAWDGSRYTAVWTEQCGGYHAIPFVSLTAATIAPDLSKVESFGIAGGATQELRKTQPRVAACGGRALAMWQLGYGPEATTAFTWITGEPPDRGRRRAAGAPVAVQRLDGFPIGIVTTPVCGFGIVTEGGGLAPFRTLYVTNISSTGEQLGTSALGPVAADESFTGSLVLQNGALWLPDARLDPSDGAQRMWAREEK